jgi:hypothetical protein
MRRVTLLIAFSAITAMLAFAGNWSGKLLDAPCYDQQKSASACSATSATTSFALEVSAKIYKLDSEGNTKAAAAIKNRADRADPSKPLAKSVMANVTGNEKDGTITVENIEVQ